MIKKLLLLLSVTVLAGCATAPMAQNTSNRPIAEMSTTDLQARRLALYNQIPRSSKRLAASPDVRGGSNAGNGYVTEYHTFGGPLPQQDEIKQIERELNLRRTRGDKAAYYELDAPHVTPVAQQSGS
ncbi:MAG: hypothetical protein M3Z64_04535 [Verrucomicrobiota bacterium]|nr:hypothetical protein [Verrucomicrobiota bacterium]